MLEFSPGVGLGLSDVLIHHQVCLKFLGVSQLKETVRGPAMRAFLDKVR